MAGIPFYVMNVWRKKICVLNYLPAGRLVRSKMEEKTANLPMKIGRPQSEDKINKKR